MLKKITLIASLLFIAVGTHVFAHAHLENSTPADKEVVRQPLNKIHLSFNENLKEASTFSLETNKRSKIPLSHLSKDGKSLEGSLTKPLPNGNYKIHWKSIGNDSHPLEGDLSFTILVPGTQKASVQSKQIANTTKKKSTDVKANKNQGKSNYFIPGMIVFLFVIGIGSYWIVFRKKHI